MRYVSKVDDKGRLSLPKKVRDVLGWHKGDCVAIAVEGHNLRLSGAREEAERLRGFVKHVDPDRDLVAELLEERRTEADRESAASAEASRT